jgi:hypothetical protein
MVLISWAESACHKRQVAVPAPVLPAPAATAPTQTPAATTSTSPPQNPASPPPTTSAQPETYQKNRVPQPSPPQSSRRTSRPGNGSPPTSPPTPAPVSPAPSPVNPPSEPPRLADLLTPAQQRQYNADIDQGVQHAQASLNSIGSRTLTKEQQDGVAQVRTFIQQALSTRGSNLPGAKSLAERAEVLARDLAASVH